MTTAARIPATMDSAVLPAPMQIARPDHRRQRHDQPWNEVEVVRPHGTTHFPDFAPVHPPLLGVQPDGGMERAGGRRRFFIQRARSRQVRIAAGDSTRPDGSYPPRRGITRADESEADARAWTAPAAGLSSNHPPAFRRRHMATWPLNWDVVRYDLVVGRRRK